ncbi:hypothetical protein PIB30_067456 [Stylosanthes scabra]|uniref:Zinc knuckle CX2CX4HX4C domain-containing protein n=1 Tax=Stylosanthes scabra TaxID=79078 RepID=A0ABU6QM36_9FABA|nr:hypothetical protein [Stylosanthes scabra]
MARPNLPKVWISFKYERIQNTYCLKCGVIGHNKKVCNKPVAAANWNHQKPRHLSGLDVNRLAQIDEMEVLEVQVDINTWENEMQPANQSQTQQETIEHGHAAASGVNNEGGEKNLGHAEGSLQKVLAVQQQPQGESSSKQVQNQPQTENYPQHDQMQIAGFQQQPHGEGTSQQVQKHVLAKVFGQLENMLKQREDSTHLPISVNLESNLQEVNIAVRVKMQVDLNIANNQEQASTQQEQTFYNSSEQPGPNKEGLNLGLTNSDITNDVSSSVDIWNFRDTPKMMRTCDGGGRKIIQRRTKEAPYIVELADKDEVMEDNKSLQPAEGTWEMELAQNINSCLQIKRKKAENFPICIEENMMVESSIEMTERANKRVKGFC